MRLRAATSTVLDANFGFVSSMTGASFTGATVIETVSVVEVSAASQGAVEQLSGSPRSVTE